jgi:hypothetical protein
MKGRGTVRIQVNICTIYALQSMYDTCADLLSKPVQSLLSRCFSTCCILRRPRRRQQLSNLGH